MTVEEALVRYRKAQHAEAKAKAAVLEAQRILKEHQDNTRTAWVVHRNAVLNARRSRQVVLYEDE